MACNSKTITLLWTTLYGDATASFLPCTPWMRTTDVKNARFTFEVRGLKAGLKVTAKFQTANVENSPTTSTVLLSAEKTADGYYYGDWEDLTSALDGVQLIRFGLETITTSGTGFARASGRIEVRDS